MLLFALWNAMWFKDHIAGWCKSIITQARDFPTVCEESLCKHRVSFYLPYPDKEVMSHRLISGRAIRRPSVFDIPFKMCQVIM